LKRIPLALFAAALSCAAMPLAAEESTLSPPHLEEAASVARSAAAALAANRPGVFEESLDRDALLRRAVGDTATLLTEDQRRRVQLALRHSISRALRPPPGSAWNVQLLSIRTDRGEAVIALLIGGSDGHLKTEWRMRPRHDEWRTQDVWLSDSARSLAEESVEALGPPPIAAKRERKANVQRAFSPRAAGLAAVVVLVAIFQRHVRRRQRWVLFLVAAVPALLFVLDGALAISRIWAEPVTLRLSGDSSRMLATARFQDAVGKRNLPRARVAADRAVSAGARPQPLALALGRLAEGENQPAVARQQYEAALRAPRPAPGAWAGLARLNAAAGDHEGAAQQWERYLAAVPPDAGSLSLLAISLGRLQKFPEARAAVARAIDLDPAEPALDGLAARLAGAAGDATGTIESLREEERQRPIDRGALAQDPNFVPIAQDLAWKAFLAEKPAR
jgi:tetratricopeptide (TPR) repeat protein